MQLSLKFSRVLAPFLPRERLHYLIVVFGIMYAAFILFAFPRWTVDDAYISFRYAYNLVKHGQLNWNVGYDPVEGYTGIMLPLLVAPVIALDGNPALASQVIGLIAFVSSALALWLILEKMTIAPMVRSIIETLFLVTPAFYTHVFAGLETLLFTTLILASFYALLRRSDAMLPVLLLLTSLTRPEGVLLAVLFLGVRIFQFWRQSDRPFHFLAKVMAFYILPGAIYFAWRWNYYGYLLPNTFYVKVNGANSEATGLDWFVQYLLLPLFATLLTFPTLVRAKKYSLEITALLFFSVLLFSLYSRSMLVMNYGHRFYMPLYSLILIVLGTLVRVEKRELKFLVIPLIPLAIQFVWCFTLLLSMEKDWIIDYQNTLVHEHVATAAYLKDHVPEGEWVILNDTGIMPYVTHRKTIDGGALNDEFLAHTHDPEAISNYLSSFHAAAITIPWFPGSDERHLDPYDFINDPGNYQLITDYKDPNWVKSHKGFRVYLFLRKDLIK